MATDVQQTNLPEDDLTAFTENLDELTKDLAARLADLAVGATKVPEVITPETEPLVTDWIGQCRLALKDTETDRKVTKDPHKIRGEAVDAHFKKIAQVLRTVYEPVLLRANNFRIEQENRERLRLAEEARVKREAEEKVRREAEAAQREAEAKARAAKSEADRRQAAADLQRAEETRVKAEEAAAETQAAEKATTGSVAARGDLGNMAFSKAAPDFRNLDLATIDLEALRPFFKIEHVEQAVRGWIRGQGKLIKYGTESLNGVEIYEKRSVTHR